MSDQPRPPKTKKPKRTGGYQSHRAPNTKFDLILGAIDPTHLNSVLDVGCNEGELTKRFFDRGLFAVGIDMQPHFWSPTSAQPEGPAFAVWPLSQERAEKLPTFDLVLLLSVHHQWVKIWGDEDARRLVQTLGERSRRYFVVEFAAIAGKYGANAPDFRDNDEDSIVAYALKWLDSLGLGQPRYIGKNPESMPKEPFRFVFVVDRSDA